MFFITIHRIMGVHCNNFGTELRLRKVWDEAQQLKSRENLVGWADLGCPKLLILVIVGGRSAGEVWSVAQPVYGSTGKSK